MGAIWPRCTSNPNLWTLMTHSEWNSTCDCNRELNVNGDVAFNRRLCH